MMGLPKGLDNIGEKIEEFLRLLKSLDRKLDKLIELEQQSQKLLVG